MRRPIRNNSAAGEAVCDPFLGSGTAVVAAETIGRTCFAIEVSPAYCDVAVQRWEQLTGREATLAGSEHRFRSLRAAKSNRVLGAP